MGDSPSATAKWSKYSVEDGKLTRKQEFCPECGRVYSWLFTVMGSTVAAVATL